MAESNEELVARCRLGDQEAYYELYRKMGALVGKVSFKYFHGSMEGEDFKADCTAKILLKIDKYDGNAKFSTWATRVAINEALGVLRSSRVRKGVSLNDTISGEEDGATYADKLADERDGFARVDALREVRGILEHMGSRSRSILIAKHVHGWTNEELQRELKTSMGSTKSIANRALKEARRVMSGLQDGSIERLSADSELGMDQSPVGDRIVRQMHPKTCPCGASFIPVAFAQKYCATCRAGKSTYKPKPKDVAPTSSVVSAPEDMEMVSITIPSTAVDKLLMLLPTKMKADAVARILMDL